LPHLFSVSRLRRSTSFHRLTGVSVATFDQMLAQLRAPWEAAERRKAKSGRPREIGGLEDHLLVLLLYYRCYVTQEFIGFFYRVDRSAICRAIQRIEAQVKPLFALHREPKISRREAEALIIDCTEQPIQRPKDHATQKAHYSGKKKRHTLKTEYIVAGTGRIVSVSDSHPGSRHDLALRRAGPPLPERARCYADSAYQGYDKEHPNLDIPYKKPKGGELGEEEKDYNRGLASFRVAIEHRIGRTKRFRILSDRYRNPRRTHHTKTSIIAGLVNVGAGFPLC
jgi:DDE superfamily endonuclease